MKIFPMLVAGAVPAYMTDAVTLLVAGAAIAYVCFRFRLVPIVGFLLAGVLIGPNALGLVHNRELVDAAAEIGVILLLFTIGIEFSLEKLGRIKRLIFIGGGLQVGLSTLATIGVLALFGVEWRTGLFTGFLIALSSTAIVLKVLGDRGETGSEQGQVALGLLIFQDLAIIVMVLLIPVLSGGGEGGSLGGIVWALTKALAIIALVLIGARRLMPLALEKVAATCSPELFLLTVIAICFGAAYVTSLAGVSLSLGAFLAGLLVSESRFSQHALGEIMPLQILFSATFFISVGILLDLRFLISNLPLVLGVVAATLLIKILTTGVSVKVLKYPAPVAAASALALAQIGEFSFVLERAGREVGLSPMGMGERGAQSFIAGTVVLMVVTPFLMQHGSRLARRITARATAVVEAAPVSENPLEHIPRLENHVIIAGYGAAARRLTRILRGSGIPYIVTTLSPQGANEAEAEGLLVLRGDYGRQYILELAGIERARMMIIADDDPTTTHRIAAVAGALNPTMRIVARTRYITEAESLRELGVNLVVAEEMESIVRIFSDVMQNYRISREEIEAHEQTVRKGGYAALQAPVEEQKPPILVCHLNSDELKRRTLTAREGTPITEAPLAALELEEQFGLKLEQVRRNGDMIAAFPPDFSVRVGDELTFFGPGAAFAKSAKLFRNQNTGPLAAVAALDASVGGPIDMEQTVTFTPTDAGDACSHLSQLRSVVPGSRGCEECLQSGDSWVHLRLCLSCGHVGCCDSSKNKHATAHFAGTGHPMVKSLERGEDWGWCYIDQTFL
jgi:monovalent cation:H+ antiporter-2, CPA2 family